MEIRFCSFDEEAKSFVEQPEIEVSPPSSGRSRGLPVEEYPLPVARDWDELVARSKRMSEVIDTHLDFEEKLQGIRMRPSLLCPEQRVSLATDLTQVVR